MTAGRALGAVPSVQGGTEFTVWAPNAEGATLQIVSPGTSEWAMQRSADGYHWARLADAGVGTRYFYRLDGGEPLPDPASRLQPQGVHGPSEVVSFEHAWRDQGWKGRALAEYVVYEVHVGTFTPGGTFDAVIPELARLRELGVTAIELMPICQFPGARNWGYDGVFPYAVHPTYGGIAGLQRLVDACHEHELAVVLDVVYNHVGPEGNHLPKFAPYFTHTYNTPWGDAINFDGPRSDDVRRYFIESALQWVEACHVDALRLDAVHAIYDSAAYPFVEELAEAMHAAGARLSRQVLVMPESDRNDPRIVGPVAQGGAGHDAVWNDDLHHALHALLTGERDGYYQDYGRVDDLARVFRANFAYAGRYSPFRGRRHGRSAEGVSPARFVVCAQNHDQVGNRMLGERLSTLVDFESLKLAAGVTLLSPFTPLLFMGEEYGEQAPFLYFIDHEDPELIEQVRRGRASEFSAFRWRGEPPDPAADSTFRRSVLDASLRDRPDNARLTALYAHLLSLRRSLDPGADVVVESEDPPVLVIGRPMGHRRLLVAYHFGRAPVRVTVPAPAAAFRVRCSSASQFWRGPAPDGPEQGTCEGELHCELSARCFVAWEFDSGV